MGKRILGDGQANLGGGFTEEFSSLSSLRPLDRKGLLSERERLLFLTPTLLDTPTLLIDSPDSETH